MKKCPTCGKEFEDSYKFCQTDGSALTEVADEPAFDPYATIVSTPANPIAPPVEDAPAEEIAADNRSMGSVPIAPPSDVLDLPDSDPLKTMYVSETEMKDVFGEEGKTDAVLDVPAPSSPPAPPVPDFIAPEVTPQIFGDVAPPPSPFASSEPEPMPVPDPVVEPAAPQFDEPETVIQPVNVPFEPPAPVQEWTPPPAPDAQWQNQQIGSNTPFQPPAAGTAGQNKTLAIVSLVLGIISLCCYVSPLTGIAALITGFLAMKKANNDPSNYGGKGLAIAGMITGGIFFLVGVAYWIYIIVVVGFVGLSNLGR